DLAVIEKLLQQHGNALEESISLTKSAIDLGTKQLKSIKGFPEDTRKSLKEFLASPDGYGIGDHQKKVIRLLEFYQQAIKIQLLPTQPLLAPPPAASVQAMAITELSSPEPAIPFDARAHAHIADELQRLITELDFAGAVGESLADIRRQLLNGITPPLLAEICLQVIELIIEGTREERKSSQAFLSTLNESLSAVHFSFTESLDEGRALQSATHDTRQAIDKELRALDHTLASHDAFGELKDAIS